MTRELNFRQDSSWTVALIWDDTNDVILLEVESDDDWAQIEIPREKASDAFDHPFVYLAEYQKRHPDMNFVSANPPVNA